MRNLSTGVDDRCLDCQPVAATILDVPKHTMDRRSTGRREKGDGRSTMTDGRGSVWSGAVARLLRWLWRRQSLPCLPPAAVPAATAGRLRHWRRRPTRSFTTMLRPSSGRVLSRFCRLLGQESDQPSSFCGRRCQRPLRSGRDGAGFYELFAWWPQTGGEGSAARVRIEHAEGVHAFPIDQSSLAGNGIRSGCTCWVGARARSPSNRSTESRCARLGTCVLSRAGTPRNGA